VPQAGHLTPTERGIDGALLDLEYQRIEVIKFNLFDNDGTYKDFITGRDGAGGPALKVWSKCVRRNRIQTTWTLAATHSEQTCKEELIRHRKVTGICNDILNPLMGSTINCLHATSPLIPRSRPEPNQPDKNRHGDRLSLLKPDPANLRRSAE
jgi:hypothetical protein